MARLKLLSPSNIDRLQQLAVLNCSGNLGSLCWSPRDDVLAVSVSTEIRLYQFPDVRQPVQRFDGHTEYIFDLAFSPAGQVLASGSADRTVRVWDLRTGVEERRLEVSDHVTSISLNTRGLLAAAENWNGRLHVWDLHNPDMHLQSLPFPDPILVIAHCPFDSSIVVGCGDGSLGVWDIGADQARWLHAHADIVSDFTFMQAGARLMTASHDATIKLWDWRAGELIRTFTSQEPAAPYTAIAQNHDSTVLASGDFDGLVRLWDAHGAGEIRQLPSHPDVVLDVAFNRDGTLLASGSADGTVSVWGIS